MELLKLQMLIPKFENKSLKDDETFFEFYIDTYFNDIINSCLKLGQIIHEFKVVRKLSFVPK